MITFDIIKNFTIYDWLLVAVYAIIGLILIHFTSKSVKRVDILKMFIEKLQAKGVSDGSLWTIKDKLRKARTLKIIFLIPTIAVAILVLLLWRYKNYPPSIGFGIGIGIDEVFFNKLTKEEEVKKLEEAWDDIKQEVAEKIGEYTGKAIRKTINIIDDIIH